MPVLHTTATINEILAKVADPLAMMTATEIEDNGKTFKKGKKTFHVLALHPLGLLLQKEFEKAITDSGHEFYWP